MASNSELQRKLNQGVEAAKAGDRSTARRLLEEVVAQDERNELAWIWLATVATGASERREYLRQVLAINPRNQRAREAMARLGEEQAPLPTTSGTNRSGIGQAPTLQERIQRSDALVQQRRSGGSNTGLILVIAAVAFMLAGLGIIVFGSGILNNTGDPILVTATPRPVSQGNLATELPTLTPTPQPTNTRVPAELITRSAATLLPTYTPSSTLSPTPTLAVTQPIELVDFQIFYLAQDPSLPEPSLLSIQADGSGGGLIEDRIRDLAFANDSFTYAFVRDIVSETGERAPEIFVSTLGDPTVVTQVTSLNSADTSSPSFSPDGSMLVFSSSAGRSAPELWVVSAGGGVPVALTNSDAGEREPAWSPVGGKIAYTSDQQVSGSTEIFMVNVTDSGEPLGGEMQATDANRNSYSPAWSADGTLIVFASDRNGDGDIFTMGESGSNEQLVTISDGDAEDRHPDFSADGLWITFVSNREDGNFQTYAIQANGLNLRRVTNNPRIDIMALFHPRRLNSEE